MDDSQQRTPGHFCWKLAKKAAIVMVLAWILYVAAFSYSLSLKPSEWFGTKPRKFQKQPSETSLQHVAFGIGSSADAWDWRKNYIDLWWKNTSDMRGFVWVDSPLPEAPSTTSHPPIMIQESTSKFKFTHPLGRRSAIRIARIIVEMVRMNLPGIRWYVLGDDDTVFFPENLVAVLRKYDHSKYFYIGTHSESEEQNEMHSYGMAFGGGGIAISAPLAESLAQNMDKCIDRYARFYGSDERICACVTELGVPITAHLGFHQLDVRGDISGLLSAHPVAPLVSLHHLDSVEPIFPGTDRIAALKKLISTSSFDSQRILQQSVCYDRIRNWTLSVSWGYSIQIMEGIVLPHVLELPLKTFYAWTDYEQTGNHPFMFSTRNLHSEQCLRPRFFFMENIDGHRDGGARTVYLPRIADNGCPWRCSKHLKKIFVKVHKKLTDDWALAPRRECCDVISSGDKKIEMAVRSCRLGESVMPPAEEPQIYRRRLI